MIRKRIFLSVKIDKKNIEQSMQDMSTSIVSMRNVHSVLRFMYLSQNIPKVTLFDVTLRDGLQSMKKCWSLTEKRKLLTTIMSEKNPSALEIGSMVSPKVLPQMADSIELFHYAKHVYKNKDFYLLVPNHNTAQCANDLFVDNISLITSVSESFQQKNIRKSLSETKSDIERSIQLPFQNVKLYISCIPNCPIEGEIPHHIIMRELKYYSMFNKITEFCISDTTGAFTLSTLKTILPKICDIIPNDKLSLHLHVDNKDPKTTALLHYAMQYVSRFDVSYFDSSGGCTVTMGDDVKSNVSYESIEQVNEL